MSFEVDSVLHNYPMAVLKHTIHQIQNELEKINQEWIDIDGGKIKAGQCYHFESDPPHLLFNLNCPENLQQKLIGILYQYLDANESSSR